MHMQLLALTVTSSIMNNFWDYGHDRQLQQTEAIQFFKVLVLLHLFESSCTYSMALHACSFKLSMTLFHTSMHFQAALDNFHLPSP